MGSCGEGTLEASRNTPENYVRMDRATFSNIQDNLELLQPTHQQAACGALSQLPINFRNNTQTFSTLLALGTSCQHFAQNFYLLALVFAMTVDLYGGREFIQSLHVHDTSSNVKSQVQITNLVPTNSKIWMPMYERICRFSAHQLGNRPFHLAHPNLTRKQRCGKRIRRCPCEIRCRNSSTSSVNYLLSVRQSATNRFQLRSGL